MKNQSFLFVLLSGVCLLLFSCEEKLTPYETTEKVLKSATWKLQNAAERGIPSSLLKT